MNLQSKTDGLPSASIVARLQARAELHPERAALLGEYWVNAPPGEPQVVLVWEADDEGPGDYYEAAWGDIFEITIAQATRPVSELPETLPEIRAAP